MSRDPRDVIIKPVVSEKSYALLDDGKSLFERLHAFARHLADLFPLVVD